MGANLRSHVIISAILSVIVMVGGFIYIGYSAFSYGVDKLNAPTADNSVFATNDPNSLVEKIDVYAPDKQAAAENYLLVGVDSRDGDNSTVGGNNGDASAVTGSRSDTIMVAHMSADKKRVSVINFPRDLSVTRPECEAWDGKQYTDEVIPSESGVKLNSVFATGGARCLVRTITALTGFQLTHYAGVDFSGFSSIVDSVGGVEVCTEYPLIDGELGTILPNAGSTTLKGEDALRYVRARKIPEEGMGDYSRIHRQQAFLSSLMNTALDKAGDPAALVGMAKTMIQYSFGENITVESILRTSKALSAMDRDDVVFMTVPTLGTDDSGNETPDMEGIQTMMKALINDDLKGLEALNSASRKIDTKQGQDATKTPEKRDEAPKTATSKPDSPAPSTVNKNSLNNGVNITGKTGGLCK